MARKRSLPKPEVDWILDRLDELKAEYSDDREVLERIRGMRNLKWDVNIPQRLEEVTGATGLEYRDATVAVELLELPTMYTEELPSLTLRAGDDTKAGATLTTRLEYFTSACLFEDCGRRATGISTLNRIIDATFEGGGWSKLQKDTDCWADYLAADIEDYADDKPGVDATDGRTKHERYDRATEEMKRKAGVPISWKAVDALNCFPIFEGDVLTGMIEVQKRSLSTCFRNYGLGLNERGEIVPERTAVRDWSKQVAVGAEVDFIQYRDREWMSYVVRYSGGYTGGPSGYAGNAYALPGYTRRHRMRLKGCGYYCSMGWTKNYEYARVATWSVSEPKRYLVQYLSWLRSIFAYLAIRDAMPPIFETTPPEGAAVLDGTTGQPRGPEIYQAGMKYTGQPGQAIQAVTFPNTADKLHAEIVQTSEDVNRLSAAKKSGQLGDLGGEGFALSIVQEADRKRFHQLEDSVLQHLTDVTLDLWSLLQDLDEPVYVFRNAKKDGGFIKVTPQDFETAVRPTWSLHVDSTAANIIKQRYAEAMEKAGYWSHDQAVEFMGGNVDEVQKGLLLDRMRSSPMVTQAEDAEVAAIWGRGAWATKQQQAQGMAAPPAAPPVPGLPGGAGQVPDQASQAMSPNGAGAAPGTEFQPPQQAGMPASPSVQTAGATAQVQGGQIG